MLIVSVTGTYATSLCCYLKRSLVVWTTSSCILFSRFWQIHLAQSRHININININIYALSLSLSLSQLSISYMYGVLMFIAMNTKARQCIPAFLCVFNASNIYFNIILLAKHTSAKPISPTLTFFYYILYSCPIYHAVRFFLNNTT